MKHLIILLILISQSAIAEEIIHGLYISGDAFDTQNQNFVYREKHLVDGKIHTVIYSDKNGIVFAEKSLSYDSGFSTPVYQLYDQRFSRQTGSIWRDNQWFTYRQEKSGARSELLLKKYDNLVIDAGFNHFIRLHFDELDSGDLLHFSFGLTDPLIELPMQIQRIRCNDYQPDQDKDNNLCLRAINSSLLYRWFVPTIYLVYSRDSRFLLRYEGPSNLPGNNDSAQTVRINYVYSSATNGKVL